MTRIPPGTYPTFAAELLDARASLTIADEVGLALRAHRKVLGLAQRAYAARRGWSKSHLARLESEAGALRLADVTAALEGTGFALGLYRVDDGDGESPALVAEADAPRGEPPVAPFGMPATTRSRAALVRPESWPRSELIARVRDGSRRFPGHRTAEQVTYPPPWWWASEATTVSSVEPHWYARGRSRWEPLGEAG